jgi:hypothetical protein
MNKIDNIFGVIQAVNNKYQTPSRTKQSITIPVNNGSLLKMNNSLINNQNLMGMKIVSQSVVSTLETANGFLARGPVNNQQRPVIEEVANLFDFEKVVQTVMAFVSSSLYAARDRGVNNLVLDEMLLQARTGVNQGIDEALGELKELNLLNDDLTLGIVKSRELISNGIDKLAEQFFGIELLKEQEASDQLEKTSMNHFIKEVNQLQKDFFNGNNEKIYQKLKQRGFDDEKLLSMSLAIKLQHKGDINQSHLHVTTYQNNQPNELNNHLKSISVFVENFIKLREVADNTFEKEGQRKPGQFEKLQSVFKAEFGQNLAMQKSFNNFIKKLD